MRPVIHVPSPEELPKPLSPRTAFAMVVEAAKKDPSLLEMAGMSPDFFSSLKDLPEDPKPASINS